MLSGSKLHEKFLPNLVSKLKASWMQTESGLVEKCGERLFTFQTSLSEPGLWTVFVFRFCSVLSGSR